MGEPKSTIKDMDDDEIETHKMQGLYGPGAFMDELKVAQKRGGKRTKEIFFLFGSCLFSLEFE